MTKKLTPLAEDTDKNLKGKEDKADWVGVDATVTRKFITKSHSRRPNRPFHLGSLR
ncbi:hypothetical protein [Streptomyces sp. NPDC101165]|uniref:hypothetical protein n=1 Tax=Streptomyces sp. NPDC101165 TaxID=3366119 RepID=UPI003804DD22